LWLAHRAIQGRSASHRLALVSQAVEKVEEAQSVFRAIREARANPARRGAPLAWSDTPAGEDALKDDVRALLNIIEVQSPFFDSVKELQKSLQKILPEESYSPLSEILQIRRDLWASAEIILVDDLKTLGPDFADPEKYDAFRKEAQSLLFGSISLHEEVEDPV